MATTGTFHVPTPVNEPVLAYAPRSPERVALDAELARQAAEVVEIPCVVGGREVLTGNVVEVRNPSDHAHVLARVHLAGPAEVAAAIDAAADAKASWARLPWTERAAVLLRAATLLAGPWRARVNAATMLGQGKTPHQAEIDAAAELIDFWRFNPAYAEHIYGEQPPVSPAGSWNRLDHRPLDGFVFAVTPFNFTSIALNLPTAPALMGNTVVWKPALTSALACWHGFELLRAAGLPDGVVNLVHGVGADVGDPVLAHPDLGGIHFTGSTATFQHMWRTVGASIERYRQYPRIVGETGGKDFIVAHPSADPEAVAIAILRGAFEFQGQKCSAASRLYVPDTLWDAVRERVVAGMEAFVMGDVRDPGVFIGPVIDERAFDKISAYVDLARAEARVEAGGTYDRTRGWFVSPTLARVSDPRHRLMKEEIFGPVASAFVYDAGDWDEVLGLVDTTSPYGLTGAVFATDRHAIEHASTRLRHAAGNFYVNDKPTGAVVGQQPFGGSRASGTNDKAGSPLNLLRWVSPRAIKETFDPPRDWRYPFLG
ncbi:MAG: L-glutamate gamma-semialdehyde dehydrogenase [Alphaproteobacteria bacterium]|nr:L-glutamate gamma-semialdehyde dehydrogenase [Alphaproteobacteria bacterium]